MSDTEVAAFVETLFAPADPVADWRALRLHLLIVVAEVAAVKTPGQVVPKLGEVVVLARRALGGRGGCAVRGHVRAWRTLFTKEGLSGVRVFTLIFGH